MSIDILTGNLIMNPVVDGGSFRISNFFLRTVRFVNNTEEQMELFKLVYEVGSANKPVKKNCLFR